jgi:hypothetical protein
VAKLKKKRQAVLTITIIVGLCLCCVCWYSGLLSLVLDSVFFKVPSTDFLGFAQDEFEDIGQQVRQFSPIPPLQIHHPLPLTRDQESNCISGVTAFVYPSAITLDEFIAHYQEVLGIKFEAYTDNNISWFEGEMSFRSKIRIEYLRSDLQMTPHREQSLVPTECTAPESCILITLSYSRPNNYSSFRCTE